MKRCLSCECIENHLTTFSTRRPVCDYCMASFARRAAAWCSYGRHAAPQATMRPGRNYCAACDNAKRKRAYTANRARELVAAKVRYQADPAMAMARVRAWEDANREHVRAYHAAYARRWRRRNPALVRQAKRRYRVRHREQERIRNRQYRVRCKLRVLHTWRGARDGQ